MNQPVADPTSPSRELAGLQYYAGKRVLVTGATGFIGRHLCHALLAAGAKVIALSRGVTGSDFEPGVDSVQVDLSDQEQTSEAIRLARPEVVFHLAGLVNTAHGLEMVIPTFQNNLAAGINLMVALSRAGCERVVIAGSSEETGNDHGGSSPYAQAKSALNNYALMFHSLYGLPVTIARIFLSYGPGQNPKKLIPYSITSFLAGTSPAIKNGDRICDLVYVEDVIRGLELAGARPGLEGQVCQVGTGTGTSLRDVVSMIGQRINPRILPVFEADPDNSSEPVSCADNDSVKKLFGDYVFKTLPAGLEETIAWYRQQQATISER